MLLPLILAFTLIPLAEVAVLIKVGEQIGAFNTIFIIIVTGIVGATLAKAQGFVTLFNIKKELVAGKLPADKIFDGVLILIGGLMLLTPGFLTDIAGFSLLIPFLRFFVKKGIKVYFKKSMDKGVFVYKSFSVGDNPPENPEIVIEAEDIEEKDLE